jgi:hypothetical protein
MTEMTNQAAQDIRAPLHPAQSVEYRLSTFLGLYPSHIAEAEYSEKFGSDVRLFQAADDG